MNNNSFTDFVNDRKAYSLNHNGVDCFCLPPSFNGEFITVTEAGRTFEIDRSYTVKVGSVRGIEAISFIMPGSSFVLRDINLADAKLAFPFSPRTYASVEDLEEKIAMSIESGNTYTVRETDGDDTVFSFTYDGDEALELIRVDSDGEMTYRDNGDWTPVEGEDNPTIFDRDLIDIEPDDVSAAVAVWDKNARNASGVKKEDMLPFAALVQ